MKKLIKPTTLNKHLKQTLASLCKAKSKEYPTLDYQKIYLEWQQLQLQKELKISERTLFVLSRAFTNEVYLDPALQSLKDQWIAIFLLSEYFTLVRKRFGFSRKKALKKLEDRLLPLFILWLLHHSPNASQLIIQSRYLDGLMRFRSISIQQLVAYLPLFVLYDLKSIMIFPDQLLCVHWMATGNNLSTCPHLPFPITKRMAHYVTMAPYSLGFLDALLYGQVMGLGGNITLFTQLNRAHSTVLSDADTRQQVIQLLVQDGRKMEEAEFAQFLGYLDHQFQEDGNYSLRKKQLSSLLRDTAQYYEALRVQHPDNWDDRPVDEHLPLSNYGGFEQIDDQSIYRIFQITTSAELVKEGAGLQHCVSSYVYDCMDGNCTIWSLRKYQNGTEKRLLTIELNKEGKILQLRGKYNTLAGRKETHFIQEWAKQQQLSVDQEDVS